MNEARPKSRFPCYRWPIFGLVSFAAVCTSISYGQPPAKVAVESFGDSLVDAIAARIKADLKEKPSVPTSPDVDSSSKNKPVKTAGPVKPVTSQRVRLLESNALKCQAAEEAMVLYRIFMVDPATTEDEREQAQARLEHWDQAASDQLVRVGTKWMSKPEADVLLSEADKLVADAMQIPVEKMTIFNFTTAGAKLEKAVKVYPEHLESVFLLGVGAYVGRDFKVADSKFTQCLGHSPNNVALLNNVAVCEVQIKRYAGAVKHWGKAASLDMENTDVAQNLGQFIADANQKKLGIVDRRVLTDATELYQKMLDKDSGNRTDPSKGYTVIKTIRSKNGDLPAEESAVIGCGTGIVVAEGIVLARRNLIEDLDAMVIQDPAKPNALPLAAKILATSKDLDLVLIECRELKGPAAEFNTVPVSQGTEAMSIGYPIVNVIGKRLKVLRSVITAVPSEETNRMIILDSEINPSHSGWPLCDKAGRIIGIVAGNSIAGGFAEKNGTAIPSKDVVAFLKQDIPEYSPTKTNATKLEWPEVEAQIGRSTVMILIQKKR